MKSEEIKLAELLCTRLCHELAGITGALQGSIEMLQEGDNSEENISLLNDAAQEIFHRLKLYRALFGKESEDGLSLAETREMIEKSGKNIRFIWPKDSWLGWQDQEKGRISSLCLVVAANILSQGGEIVLSESFKIDFRGRIRKPSDNSGDPRNSEWFLAQKLATDKGTALKLSLDPNSGVIEMAKL